jgi:hypothetical protein
MADERLVFEEQQQLEEERALRSAVNAERVEYRHHEFQVRSGASSAVSVLLTWLGLA